MIYVYSNVEFSGFFFIFCIIKRSLLKWYGVSWIDLFLYEYSNSEVFSVFVMCFNYLSTIFGLKKQDKLLKGYWSLSIRFWTLIGTFLELIRMSEIERSSDDSLFLKIYKKPEYFSIFFERLITMEIFGKTIHDFLWFRIYFLFCFPFNN